MKLEKYHIAIFAFIGGMAVPYCIWKFTKGPDNEEEGLLVSSVAEERHIRKKRSADGYVRKRGYQKHVSQEMTIGNRGLADIINLIQKSVGDDFPWIFDHIVKLNNEDKLLALELLVSKWVAIDLASALNYIGSIEDGDLSHLFMLCIIASWPDGELDYAFKYINEIEDDQLRSDYLAALVSRASSVNPPIAADLLEYITNPSVKAGLLSSLINTWARSDPEGSLVWVTNNLRDEQLNKSLFTVGSIIATYNPESALDIVSAMDYGVNRDDLLRSIAVEWIQMDAEEVILWCESLDRADCNLVIDEIPSSWAKVDPYGALQFGFDLHDRQRDAFLLQVVSELGRSDPEGALSWMSDNEVEVDSRVMYQLYDSWASSSSVDLVNKIGSIRDAEEVNMAVMAVSDNMGRQDPVSASRFVDSLPMGKVKNDAVSRVALHWVHINSVEASAWIAGMDPGEARDRGSGQIAYAILDKDPISAFEWVLSMSSPIARDNWVGRHGRQWVESNPDQAREVVEALGDDVEYVGLLEFMSLGQ